ncbi:murein DD-endopeptidase MepM [[Haemophilus] felis]|nr:murein DD-endopeptidase MepM [[Haemophilus] felis]
MQHIKLARDRRKQKLRIKIAIVFFAALSIMLGVWLHYSSKDPVLTPSSNSPQTPSVNTMTEASQSNQTESSASSSIDATSFYDPNVKDDESDEIEAEPKIDLTGLPENARDALLSLFDGLEQAIKIKNQFAHTVANGDTLKDILELSGLEPDAYLPLLDEYPELKKLRAGQQIYWITDNQNELEYLNWLVSEREERIYERDENRKFKHRIIKKQSVWKREILKGKIEGSFNSSLHSLGLQSRQINQLSSALQWQTNLKKLKKGDKFALYISREYIEDKLTGQGNVEAIHIVTGGKSYYAIQASNGRFYNNQGETLSKGFARYPLQRQGRISSPFNPRRKHPITGRISPHKGVDFSLPVGSPVIAPADGTVEKVAYQASGAGRYIIVRHSKEYQTVYMHLSKSLVKAGQTIKKGQRIALSGNTGRSTGPHLHYEFHINGRPVNPMTVKLPNSSRGLANAERKQFLVRAKEIERKLKITP